MKRTLTAAIIAMAAAALSACGFTPLYGEQGVSPDLSHVEVVAPDGRTAFLLRERLDDQLAHDRAAPPAYRLNYDLTEVRIPRGLGPDNAASRYELNLRVDWKLTDLSGAAAPVRTGRTDVLVTYAAVDPPYGGIAAQEDGQERAAGEAARRIRLELAQYFAAKR